MSEEIRDVLPDDLNAVDNLGPRDFPDNSRRRIPGVLYALAATGCAVAWWFVGDSDQGTVGSGLVIAGAILAFAALMSLTSGWRMKIDETGALVSATRAVGFPVGHASAQQVWRGARSRPTWRIFCYSTEEPPLQRGLVLVDAIDGHVVEVLVEENPRDAAEA